MRSSIKMLTLIVASYLAPIAVSQTPQTPPMSSPFAGLKGLHVTLMEKPGGTVEILILDDGKVGTHIVLENYSNFIVIEDISRVSKRWLPVTSIYGVVRIKTK